jgi:hypothetical protein
MVIVAHQRSEVRGACSAERGCARGPVIWLKAKKSKRKAHEQAKAHHTNRHVARFAWCNWFSMEAKNNQKPRTKQTNKQTSKVTSIFLLFFCCCGGGHAEIPLFAHGKRRKTTPLPLPCASENPRFETQKEPS